MSFAEKIRILKFETPRVDVIISEALASGVTFDAEGEHASDYTSGLPIEKPPGEMSRIELFKLAEAVLGEMGYMGSPDKPQTVLITDGTGKVIHDCTACKGRGYFKVLAADGIGWSARTCDCPAGKGMDLRNAEPDLSDIPEQDFSGGVRGKYAGRAAFEPSQMNPLNNAPKKKRVLPKFDDLKIVSEEPIPEPDTKARGKVVIHRLMPITDSSVIEHVGYDPRTCTLEVGIKAFRNESAKKPAGKRKAKAKAPKRVMRIIRYRFKDVPAQILVGILTAESAGVYFNNMVKPHYIGRRVP